MKITDKSRAAQPTTIASAEIAHGTVFSGKIAGRLRPALLKAYIGVVNLEDPGETWTHTIIEGFVPLDVELVIHGRAR